jgi:uncharacterized protein
MSFFSLASANLLSPAVLAFALGVLGARLNSDLRLPAPIPTLLSTYLLLAIGLKGGVALANADASDLPVPVVATLVIGTAIPLATYLVLRRFSDLTVPMAAAFAAFYGSVSAVTFTAANTFVLDQGLKVEGFLPALLALMEIPGIIIALVIAARAGSGMDLKAALHEVVTGRSVMLLVGGLTIGALSGAESLDRVAPFFVAPFQGILVLFLLDLGVVAGEKIGDLRTSGRAIPLFALFAPIVFGSIGVVVGHLAGLSVGGTAIFASMAASASYIAAPAAVRVALPDVDVGVPLAAAIGITFPFNLIIGIPLFTELAYLLG